MKKNEPNGMTACSLAVLCLFCGASATAQDSRSHPIVIREVRHDVSPALEDLVASANLAPTTDAEASAGSQVGTTSGPSFDGIAAGILNGTPNPDVNGAAGATQFVQWENALGTVVGSSTSGEIAVWDKAGNLQLGPISESVPWKGFGAPCSSTLSSQNIVQYDKAANRWVMVRHVYPTTPPNYVCFAVSQTSSFTGSTKFNRYTYALSNNQLDHPVLGVWPDAYYMSFNLLTEASPHTFISPEVCAFDRNGMIAGSAAKNPVCFQPSTTLSTLLPSDLDGSTPPPTGSPNYYVNLDTNSLDIWQFHVDFTTPSNSTFMGPTNIPVEGFMQACSGRKGVCIPQLGTTQLLRAWGDRLMPRLAYRNFGDHESIVATHTVNPPLTNAHAAVRWYEIRSPGLSPTIYQGGTWEPDDTSRWMMSIAMDKVGDIAVGYSASCPGTPLGCTGQYPAVAYTGRVPSDPLGTLETPEAIVSPACPAGQTCNQVFNSGWGSYTSMSIDPVDDCTFWYTNEYYIQQGSKIWNTRIASFKFPSCM